MMKVDLIGSPLWILMSGMFAWDRYEAMRSLLRVDLELEEAIRGFGGAGEPSERRKRGGARVFRCRAALSTCTSTHRIGGRGLVKRVFLQTLSRCSGTWKREIT